MKKRGDGQREKTNKVDKRRQDYLEKKERKKNSCVNVKMAEERLGSIRRFLTRGLLRGMRSECLGYGTRSLAGK